MNAFADVRYLSTARYEQVDTRFDREMGVYWAWMHPKPRPFFNPQLLAELSSYVDTIENGAGTMADARGERGELRYTVIASRTPGVFNLGGDLSLFKAAIQRRDRATLVHYGRSCVDTLFRWWQNCHLPLTTISLVQGDALGGGFECALSSSVLIAEEDARMGFPEILFNLFPGMGAYSFLSRKVGRPDHRGPDHVRQDLLGARALRPRRRRRHHADRHRRGGRRDLRAQARALGNGPRGIEAIAREMNPLKHEELVRVVELWADAALKLSSATCG
jgi:DSF synthase